MTTEQKNKRYTEESIVAWWVAHRSGEASASADEEAEGQEGVGDEGKGRPCLVSVRLSIALA